MALKHGKGLNECIKDGEDLDTVGDCQLSSPQQGLSYFLSGRLPVMDLNNKSERL